MNNALHRLANELDAPAKNAPQKLVDKVQRAEPSLPPDHMEMRDGGDHGALPPDRLKAVEYGIAQFQQIGHERDELRKEIIATRERVAALEIEAEGLRSQLNDAESKVITAYMVRDKALADRIKYESLFVSVQAQMRAFAVPAAPLISDADKQ